jgi:hypothetical protein
MYNTIWLRTGTRGCHKSLHIEADAPEHLVIELRDAEVADSLLVHDPRAPCPAGPQAEGTAALSMDAVLNRQLVGGRLCCR